MKRYIFCLFLIFSFHISNAQVLPRPVPQTLVTDAAHLLSADQVMSLENKLVAIDNSSSNQIAIVTIPDLNGLTVEDYANKLLRDWGIGTKKNNNGVLILVSAQDHKIRIEVGYGLEGAIPDVTANDIITNDLTPNFKANKYYEGLDLATDDIAKAAIGEYNSPRPNKAPWSTLIIVVFIVIIIIISTFRNINNGKKGGMISRRGSGPVLPFLLGSMLGGGLGGGGFGGGGDGGGGGFGGFGGGGGGGGGASGGW